MSRHNGNDDVVVVVEEHDLPISSRRFYTEVPSGEALLIARDRGWNGDKSAKVHIDRITEMLRLFDMGGPIHEYFSNKVLWEFYDRIISQGDRPPTASSSSYPPLTSDNSSHGEIPIPDASLPSPQELSCSPTSRSSTSATETTGSTTLLSTRGELEPLVLISVRQVLARDSAYAEEVVLSLNKLPIVKRDILFNRYYGNPSKDDSATTKSSLNDTSTLKRKSCPSTTDLEVWKACRSINAGHASFKNTKTHKSVPGINYTPANSQGSPRQAPSGKSPQTKGGQSGKRQGGKHRVQKSSRGKPKKRAKLSNDGDDSDSDGEASSTQSDRVRKLNSRWACPYSLAFASMIEIARFKSCRPPGSLSSRSLWKDHLREYHSPQARLSNPNADHSSFYMNDKQWEKVQARIAKDKLRPRPYDEWFKIQKECFLEVWSIIFPEEENAHSNAPLSPFHPDSSLFANLGPQIDILLETIRNVKAEQAVSAGSIETPQDFHPTNEQYVEMMKDVIAIVINMSPGASQWMANISPQGLQASVTNHNRIAPQAKEENATSENATSENATSEAPASPEPTLDTSSGSSLSDDSADPAAATTPTTVIPLFPLGTHISLQVSPNYAPELNQQLPLLKVTTPSGFFINGMSQAPTLLPTPILPQIEFDPSHQCLDPSLIVETAAGQMY